MPSVLLPKISSPPWKSARGTDMIGIFSDRAAIVRLVGAVLMEQMTNGPKQRRYMGPDILAKVSTSRAPGPRTRRR
jgi:hypothetical protein